MRYNWGRRECPSYSTLLLFAVIINALVYTTEAVVQLPPNMSIPAVFAFGDSIVDTGNNNNLKTFVKCDFPPYGVDFNGGTPTGRFSDGKVPTDIIAEEMGIKETVPAYLDPLVLPQDLTTGVSFASGGAGYETLTAELVEVISLPQQLEYFKEYIAKLKGIVGEEKTNFTLNNSIFLLVAGSDDIANTYYTFGANKVYNISDFTDRMINSASSFLQDLYNLGARRVAVFSAPPVGCVPAQRTLAGGSNRTCADDINIAALLFNSKLSTLLDSLNHTLPDSRIVYIDAYNPLFDLIQNPQNYGFEVADRGCCGTGSLEVAALCNQYLPITCSNISSHVFWDSYHPTEAGYRTIVSLTISKYVDQFQ